ncbi:MAG TPA: AraC family transcriptional regulator [Spirochaetota bacterium]|nr:AraC family transcriptional regulator [Spirochaetota bacterium]
MLKKIDSRRVFRVNDYYHITFLSNTVIDKHSHKGFSELTCLKRGRLKHYINNRLYKVQAPSIIYIREGDSHHFNGYDYELINIAFPLKYFYNFLSIYSNHSLEQFLFAAEPPELLRTRTQDFFFPDKEIELLFNNSTDNNTKIVLHRFLLNLFYDFLYQEKEIAPDTPLWFTKVINFIRQNYNRQLSVAMLAGLCGLSREHLSRTFRKVTGMGLSAFINNYRLKKCAQMLRLSDQPVSAIAFSCGFNNLNYFNKLFRKAYCCTPRSYRRQRGSSLIRKW